MLDTQLCFALYSASSRLTAVYRDLLKPYDLTYTQFLVLMALWEQDDVPITQLAERIGVTKATMTPLLKLLEKKGLIERSINAKNERQKQIVLTKAGRALSKDGLQITEQAFCMSGLSKKQAQEIIKLCSLVAK